MQITKEFERFAMYLPNVVVMPVFGGVSLTGQKDQITMKYPNIVVGCPGRVKQLGRDKILDYSHVKHFVMDECDKMLARTDMRADVQDIFRMTLHNKQTMMFSATMSPESRLICKKFLHNVCMVATQIARRQCGCALSLRFWDESKQRPSVLNSISFFVMEEENGHHRLTHCPK